MRALPEIRGLKFPDEFVLRHFFKRGLLGSGTALGLTDRTTLRVRFDNLQSGRIVAGNSDLAVRGRAA